jgi:hypothetical protein
MPSGSCFCGKVKINYTAERITAVRLIHAPDETRPYFQALIISSHNQGLCHCLDCRKLSGSPYTYNFIAHRSEIEVTGNTPGKITKTADSENAVVNYFCTDCGMVHLSNQDRN